ncbi:MAG: 1-deoxy-D-xylulose-5-phosphate reductoisomerase [Oscillospiraceae bacterium]|jgi:1-deoxy-D-xylulose-5-phosphate reductoisomerase|nr:1-deoxy-D-xylulose-5-phosphate reductoisomerase [Oscillospiraceae bacterium]
MQYTILGATGSIGIQALDVVERLGGEVLAITGNTNAALMEAQIRRHQPKYAAMADEAIAKRLRVAVADTPCEVLGGEDGVARCAEIPCDMTLNAIVGIAGLRPTLAAIEAGNKLALANKESLVAGGALVMERAKARGIDILPVDSEHSAIFQAIQGSPRAVKRLILTASGGAFFGKTLEELRGVTIQQALKHPSWSMGAKITIDSATMMNKGFEVIEAAWLFRLPPAQIDVLIHRQSIVHSLAEFTDHSVLAQLGNPDMRLPIQYAFTYPARMQAIVPPLDLAQIGALTFEPPDDAVFPAVNLCRKAFEMGWEATVALNAANEAANEMFRAGECGFLDIVQTNEEAVARVPRVCESPCLGDILELDAAVRMAVRGHC